MVIESASPLTLSDHDLQIMTVGLKTPQNFGALYRLCGCFGITQVHHVGAWTWRGGANDARGEGLHEMGPHERALMSANAKGCEKYVTCNVWSFNRLLEWLSEHKDGGSRLPIVALEIVDGAVPLSSFTFPSRCVLMAGAEGSGVDHRILQRLVKGYDHKVFIEMQGAHQSLNVTHAIGMAICEFRSQQAMGARKSAASAAAPTAAADESHRQLVGSAPTAGHSHLPSIHSSAPTAGLVQRLIVWLRQVPAPWPMPRVCKLLQLRHLQGDDDGPLARLLRVCQLRQLRHLQGDDDGPLARLARRLQDAVVRVASMLGGMTDSAPTVGGKSVGPPFTPAGPPFTPAALSTAPAQLSVAATSPAVACEPLPAGLLQGDAELRLVDEGEVRLLVSPALAQAPGSSVGFYNPKMTLRRSLCVHSLAAAVAPGAWANTTGEGLGAAGHTLRVLDGFSASGSIAMRWLAALRRRPGATRSALPGAMSGAVASAEALEGGASHERAIEVTAADLDAGCCAMIARNAALNGFACERLSLPSVTSSPSSLSSLAWSSSPSPPSMSPSVSGLVPLRVACADFRALLLHAPPFDFVHVDPFGSCVPFLDTLASRAAHGSVVSVTATDTSVLFANYPEVMTPDDL